MPAIFIINNDNHFIFVFFIFWIFNLTASILAKQKTEEHVRKNVDVGIGKKYIFSRG